MKFKIFIQDLTKFSYSHFALIPLLHFQTKLFQKYPSLLHILITLEKKSSFIINNKIIIQNINIQFIKCCDENIRELH